MNRFKSGSTLRYSNEKKKEDCYANYLASGYPHHKLLFNRLSRLTTCTAFKIGKTYLNNTPVYFDVHGFIIAFNGIAGNMTRKLDRFFIALDDKIRVKKSNPKSRIIIQEIDQIITELFSPIFGKMSRKIRNIRMRHSGSLYSDLRVGRPYEADILISFKRPKDWNKITEKYLMDIAKTSKMKDWILHGVKIHRAGCCLLLENKNTKRDERGEGVLVDVIPILEQSENIDINELKQEVRNLWGNKLVSLDTTKHTLLKHEGLGNKHDFSSGFLENQLLDTLPECVKRGYRMAKYLVQSQLGVDEPCVSTSEGYFDISGASQQHLLDLYGHKPAIKSHILRVFLVQLLTQANEEERNQLKGDVLCICLLDMLYQVLKSTHLMCIENPITEQSMEKVVDILHRGVDNKFVVLYALEKIVDDLRKNSAQEERGLENYSMFTKTDTIAWCTKKLKEYEVPFQPMESLCDLMPVDV